MSYSSQNILLLLLAVWVVVYALSRFSHLESRGVEVKPLYLMFRTKRFNDIMVRTATKHSSLWRAYGNLSIAASFILIASAVYTLGINLYNFVFVPRSASPVVPIVPGVTVSLSYFPYMLFAIAIAVTIHEGAHGIISSVEKIGLKSSGIIIAPITFGAFVEPDEEQFEKAGLASKLRVLASGSLTNMIAGLLVILLLIALYAPQSGILITSVQTDGPAYQAGLHNMDVIYSINGSLTPNYLAMRSILAIIKPGENIVLGTSRGQIQVLTIPNPVNSSLAFLGITSLVSYSYHPLRIGEFSTQFTYNLTLVLDWIQLIMVNLAIFNMLPMFPLDGDGFVHNILKDKLKKGSDQARIIINIFSFTLLGSNLVLSFIRYGANLI